MKTGQLNPGSPVKPPSPVVGELAETLLELRLMTPAHLEKIATLTRAYHQSQLDANGARSAAQKVQNDANAAVADLEERRQEHEAKIAADLKNLEHREDELARLGGDLKQDTEALATRERALAGREEAVSVRERTIERVRAQLGDKS